MIFVCPVTYSSNCSALLRDRIQLLITHQQCAGIIKSLELEQRNAEHLILTQPGQPLMATSVLAIALVTFLHY